jgi:type II secretory pathway pseudopilin PulG
MISLKFQKRGQVWVETVVYTLIGLSLIGLVLAIITPQIKESRDTALIEQTIKSFNLIDSKINEVVQAPGNKRKVELGISRGSFYVNPGENSFRFELEDSKVKYSELGVNLSIGRVNVTTLKLSKDYKIILKMGYRYDITFEGEDSGERKFTAVSIPYKLFIENKGFDSSNNLNIDIQQNN